MLKKFYIFQKQRLLKDASFGLRLLRIEIKLYKRFLKAILPMLLIGLIGVFVLGIDNVCYAASFQVSSGLPWDDLLNTLGKELTGPIPRVMASLAAALAGVMLMFGETGGMFKKSLQIVFGISIAIGAWDWVSYVMSGHTGGSAGAAAPAFSGKMTDSDFLSSFTNYFSQIAIGGAANLQGPTLKLLAGLAAIEIALSVAFNFEQDHFKYIFKQTIKIGFFVFLIENWVGGTFTITKVVFESFQKLGLLATGLPLVLGSDIAGYTIKMIGDALTKTFQLGWGSLGVLLLDLSIIVGIVLCMFFMAIEIVMVKIEFYIFSVLTIPLLPFGINKHTRFLFEKATGAVVSLGIKVMVLTFVSSIAGPVLASMVMSIADSKNYVTAISSMLTLLLGCIAMFLLVKKAPEMAQGLLSGTPSLSGGDAMQTLGAVAHTAAAVYTGGMSAAGKMAAASAMPGGRDAAGKINITGTMKNLGRIGAAKMKNPFHDSMHDTLYQMGKQQSNIDAIKAAKSGDMGAATVKLMKVKDRDADEHHYGK